MGVAHLPAPSDMSRGGFIFPMEDDRWIVSLGERHGEEMPGDLDKFIAFTKTFRTSTINDAIRNAKPLGDVARYNLPASVRRHFDKLDRFPRGLIPLGDFGLPLQPRVRPRHDRRRDGGGHPRQQLASHRLADPLTGLAADYLARIQDCLEAPWATAVSDLVHPLTRGERPPDFDKRMQYGMALTRLAAEDADVHRTLAR